MPLKQTTAASMQSVLTLRDPSIVAARMDLMEMVLIALVSISLVLVNYEIMMNLTAIGNIMKNSTPCIREDWNQKNLSVLRPTLLSKYMLAVRDIRYFSSCSFKYQEEEIEAVFGSVNAIYPPITVDSADWLGGLT